MNNSKKVTVRLFGGLGNQLFQYFAGLDLSIKSGSKLIIDFRWIESTYSQDASDIRDFKFLKDTSIMSQEFGKLNFKIERLKTIISRKSQIAAKFFALNTPKSPGFSELSALKPGVELRGYYQSNKYFDTVSRTLGTQDWSLEIESRLFLNFKSQLDAAPFIAVHVRGGDYLKKSNIYHRLDATYYVNSLSRLKSELGDIRVFVFSDDSEYARDILKNVPTLEFLDQEGLRASEAMVLMSLAQGIVIANSTFSYWAAMINAGKLIASPKYWYKDVEVDENLYPPSWIIV